MLCSYVAMWHFYLQFIMYQVTLIYVESFRQLVACQIICSLFLT